MRKISDWKVALDPKKSSVGEDCDLREEPKPHDRRPDKPPTPLLGKGPSRETLACGVTTMARDLITARRELTQT